MVRRIKGVRATSRTNTTRRNKAYKSGKGSTTSPSRRASLNVRKGDAWQGVILQAAAYDRRIHLFKVPENFRPSGASDGEGASRVINGRAVCTQGKSVWVDIVGVVEGGRSVNIEAKTTSSDSWKLNKRLREVQIPHLLSADKLGAVAAVYVRSEMLAREYFIPVRSLRHLPASIAWEDLEVWRVPPMRSYVDACAGWCWYVEGGWGVLKAHQPQRN